MAAMKGWAKLNDFAFIFVEFRETNQDKETGTKVKNEVPEI